ncbi:unnamed protein product [Toxocara canis]|uniref:ANK_REP_REGION domain-containing protein n=1 Tax=Toxocara canis TaxID=6265 RepID=A0A183U3F0_TOXCA|nr:unnamed protein product [Toxocara canis]
MKTSQGGATALHLAVEPKIVNIIAEGKQALPLSSVDSNEDTPLARASLNGFLEVAKTLLKAGADISEKYRSGVTLLLRAIAAKNDETSVFLLNSGADATASDITVGDLIVIQKNKRVPADLVLLRTTEKSGASFIRTDELDGETDWKLRIAVPVTQNLPRDEVSFRSVLVLNEAVSYDEGRGAFTFLALELCC